LHPVTSAGSSGLAGLHFDEAAAVGQAQLAAQHDRVFV